MSEQSCQETSFDSQYSRVLDAAECRTQVQLASLLDIRQSSISDAKRRGSVPSDWLVKLFEKKRINPDWIRCGVGEKYLSSADSEENLPHIVRVTEVRPPQECSSQDLINELVRRALQEADIKALQKEVAGTWLPAKEL